MRCSTGNQEGIEKLQKWSGRQHRDAKQYKQVYFGRIESKRCAFVQSREEGTWRSRRESPPSLLQQILTCLGLEQSKCGAKHGYDRKMNGRQELMQLAIVR